LQRDAGELSGAPAGHAGCRVAVADRPPGGTGRRAAAADRARLPDVEREDDADAGLHAADYRARIHRELARELVARPLRGFGASPALQHRLDDAARNGASLAARFPSDLLVQRYDAASLRELLGRVAGGAVGVEEALSALRSLP